MEPVPRVSARGIEVDLLRSVRDHYLGKQEVGQAGNAMRGEEIGTLRSDNNLNHQEVEILEARAYLERSTGTVVNGSIANRSSR